MFVHALRIQKQFEFLSALGIDINPLYKQIGLDKNKSFNPTDTYDFEQFKTVLDFALRQTNNPEYGLDFGTQPQLGGTIGMMSASCINLKEAFVQGCKFFKLQGDFAEIAFIDDENYPRLVYSPIESWILESPHTAKLEVDATFSFLNTILNINSNNTLKPKEVNFTFAKPDDIKKYVDIFGVQPNFGANFNELVFHRETLLIPMKAFNAETFNVLRTYLESQVKQMNNSETISEKVKRILHSSFKYQFPDIETVADKLNLSARTLQRKLLDEQATFKSILQESRFGIAKKLLKQDTLTISEISYTLGYSDLGNFSRSFKKYVGISPLEYRER